MTEIISDAEYKIAAAQITGAHGVSGNVRVRLIGANAEVSSAALKNTPTVLASREEPPMSRMLTLASLRKQSDAKGAWIARFKELTDRTAAEEMYGCMLLVPQGSLPALPEGEFYVDDLIGIEMATDTGRSLGELVEVLHTPANDVYVTSTGAMVPAVSEFIKSIDITARRIVVADVPGL